MRVVASSKVIFCWKCYRCQGWRHRRKVAREAFYKNIYEERDERKETKSVVFCPEGARAANRYPRNYLISRLKQDRFLHDDVPAAWSPYRKRSNSYPRLLIATRCLIDGNEAQLIASREIFRLLRCYVNVFFFLLSPPLFLPTLLPIQEIYALH